MAEDLVVDRARLLLPAEAVEQAGHDEIVHQADGVERPGNLRVLKPSTHARRRKMKA